MSYDQCCNSDSVMSLPERRVTRQDLYEMPADYRTSLVRLMAMQAYCERNGATELGHWVVHAPSYRERRVVGRIVSDEAYHAYLLYRELELIGVSESEAIDIAEGRKGEGAHAASLAGPIDVSNSNNEWIDVVLNHMFLDRAGSYMVHNFSKSSYLPWAKICKKILKDERMHESFGFGELRRYVEEDYDREDLAKRLTHWFAHGLNFFGPPKSSMTERLRTLGLKQKDNEQLRQAYYTDSLRLLKQIHVADLVQFTHTSFPYS